MSNLVLDIEFITRPEGLILDTRTSYLLASDWFMNNGMKWCREVGTYKWNSNEKCHRYRRVFTTDREIFKEKFSARDISPLAIVS